jgi:uncharacterized membrane protein YfcA
MKLFANKFLVAVVCIVAGVLVLVGMPEILRWIIGIVLIVYGVLVLLGKK